jgi:hypothetical protein
LNSTSSLLIFLYIFLWAHQSQPETLRLGHRKAFIANMTFVLTCLLPAHSHCYSYNSCCFFPSKNNTTNTTRFKLNRKYLSKEQKIPRQANIFIIFMFILAQNGDTRVVKCWENKAVLDLLFRDMSFGCSGSFGLKLK